MGRFLTTLPVNYGLFNQGTIETYPTGGSGPTAYGPTSYFGSDPLPPRLGDSINNPIDLGSFSSVFNSRSLKNKHGGNSRIQSTFYQFNLSRPLFIQLTQNYSPYSYQENTNRNTIVSFYKLEDGNRRRELPINNAGYVFKETSIEEPDSGDNTFIYSQDYPTTSLEVGSYILLITNDIRYQETTYSFTINASVLDWGYVIESSETALACDLITGKITGTLDFGTLTSVYTTKNYPYSSTSGLGYTQDEVSP